MRSGLAPEAAISDSLGRNGMADAGLIALSVGGEIYAANSPLLDSFEDRGSAILRGPSGATVAVLHNAILPYRGLALIAAEIALNIIDGTKQAPDFIRIDAGLRIIPALDNAVDIDAKGNAIAICVADPHHVAGRRSFGLGYHAIIRRGGRLCGRLAYEPYLVAVDGRLVSIDGADTATVPAVLESPSF